MTVKKSKYTLMKTHEKINVRENKHTMYVLSYNSSQSHVLGEITSAPGVQR